MFAKDMDGMGGRHFAQRSLVLRRDSALISCRGAYIISILADFCLKSELNTDGKDKNEMDKDRTFIFRWNPVLPSGSQRSQFGLSSLQIGCRGVGRCSENLKHSLWDKQQ